MQAEPSACGDEHIAVMERIGQLRQTLVGPSGGAVELHGALHAESLVRPFSIEFLNESVETFLLLQAVGAWRTGCFLLECEMHTLVAAVLLRMAGLDTFDRN